METAIHLRKEMIEDVTYTSTIVYARGGAVGQNGTGIGVFEGHGQTTTPKRTAFSLDRAVGISRDA